MSSEAFAAYAASGGAPLAGLSPSWHAAYNAATGATVSGPGIAEVDGGTYRLIRPAAYDLVGIIDLGATADPRYMFAPARTVESFAAYAASGGAPLAGLSPSWVTLYNANSGAAFSPQPAFVEIGLGVYKFPKPAATEHLAGIIDLGASATPRYLYYETGVGVIPHPTLAPVGVGVGGGAYVLD